MKYRPVDTLQESKSSMRQIQTYSQRFATRQRRLLVLDKPVEVVEDKFASMRSDPAFLAPASLRARISGRAILSRNLKETFNADEANNGGDEDDEVKGEDHEAGEESDHEPEAAEDGEFEVAQAEFEAAEDREFEVAEDHHQEKQKN